MWNMMKDYRKHPENIIRVLAVCAIILRSVAVMAQTDSVCRGNTICTDSVSYRFEPLQIIVPGTLIGVGVIGLESDWLKFQNKEIRDELQEKQLFWPVTVRNTPR